MTVSSALNPHPSRNALARRRVRSSASLRVKLRPERASMSHGALAWGAGRFGSKRNWSMERSSGIETSGVSEWWMPVEGSYDMGAGIEAAGKGKLGGVDGQRGATVESFVELKTL